MISHTVAYKYSLSKSWECRYDDIFNSMCDQMVKIYKITFVRGGGLTQRWRLQLAYVGVWGEKNYFQGVKMKPPSPAVSVVLPLFNTLLILCCACYVITPLFFTNDCSADPPQSTGNPVEHISNTNALNFSKRRIMRLKGINTVI